MVGRSELCFYPSECHKYAGVEFYLISKTDFEPDLKAFHQAALDFSKATLPVWSLLSDVVVKCTKNLQGSEDRPTNWALDTFEVYFPLNNELYKFSSSIFFFCQNISANL